MDTRKMNKKRRQRDLNGGASGGSTGSSQESITDKSCPHLNKAFNFNSIKKHTKKTGIRAECSTCKKEKALKEHINETEQSDIDIWVCLLCGEQNCGIKNEKHAQKHYEKPHSDSHYIAINIKDWNIWCYRCSKEITLEHRRKTEVVDFIQKSLLKSPITSQQTKVIAAKNQKVVNNVNNINNVNNVNNVNKEKDKGLNNLPKVMGLHNLGNTCFFNAVLQCLARTPYLVKVLDDLCTPGEKFILPGGKFKPDPNGEEVELPPIESELEGGGQFTSILCKTLTEMQNCTSQQSFSPQELLNTFKKKAMQCMDGGQHDSHELLRHLLELVRNEDVRRYQSIIMKELRLSKKTIPETVENSIKAKVKFYGNQVNTKLLGPEPVFMGVLVSTLECMKCNHSSQCTEPFLDLSLPVTADKPQPPVFKRKNNGLDETFDIMGNSYSNTLSKQQLKKERKASRKNRKNRNITADYYYNDIIKHNKIIEENGVLESEESDADIEDNVEGENTCAEVGESGYSSEKASAVASPVSPTNYQIDNQRRTSQETLNVSTEKSLDVKSIDNSKTPLNNDTITVSALNSSSPSDVSMADITKMRLSSEADKIESSESNENENNAHTGLSLSTSLVINSDLTSSDVLTVSPLSSSITSKDSPMSPLSNVPNGDEGEKVNRLLSGFDKTESNTNVETSSSSIKTKKETFTTAHNQKHTKNSNSEKEVNVGINDITSGLSRLGITNSTHHSPTKYPRKEEEYSIQSCLNQFTTLELMSGSNEVGCEQCTEAEKKVKVNCTKMICTPHTKQYLISRVPPVLILQLKRFQAQRVTFRKVTRRVAFPLVFDLSPVCKNSRKPRIYALYGVVEHYGSTIDGGHYIAYVKTRAPLSPNDARWSFLPRKDTKDVEEVSNDKNPELEGEATAKLAETIQPPPGKWYSVSDARIIEVDESTVLRCQAYLLFYERIL
uniref:ubiquitin carboxyl-terminal hydrolase 45 isoform X1 n=2 Tax=Vespula vulgaris TaxID=7454 RepID=UPI002128F602|nr:ubiquitin carboxyl-terminal hydrolase 45 isoform X1 [Vespula vulgaris]XP_050867489.1 ubiquitin carboxyl-terminal hydrolase 45 isoform X1 [Vespula vulgaris]XP_050867492.1 ubiquitin carboxyl-terminal hydrolase 45 isoform X1 [Vespula vulgaris]